MAQAMDPVPEEVGDQEGRDHSRHNRHLRQGAPGTGLMLDLNFNAFAGSPVAQVVTEPLPLYLYDDDPWNDIRYLLQAQTLGKAAE